MTTTEHTTRTPSTTARCQHTAKFFVEESDLYNTLANFVREGLSDDQGVVVTATRSHWKGLRLHLANAEVRIDEAIQQDQLVFLDAQELRNAIMVKGAPDQARFDETIGEQVARMVERWSQVRVYDETVDVLAADSQFGPMRQLEQLWEQLRSRHEFTLMSGYGLEHFGEFDEEEPFDNVCNAHQEVLAADDDGGRQVARWQRRAIVLSKRLEQEQRANRELEAALAEQRERQRRVDEFMGQFTHELRNPLAPILTAIEMMNLRGDDTNERERSIIERQVGNLVELVDDYLDAFRLTFGDVELQELRIEAAEVVGEAVAKVAPLIEERDVHLEVDVADSGLMLEADPQRLAQAIVQLIDNAARASKPGQGILLRAEREAGSVAISVRDEGAGMEPGLLDQAFEMFSRGERNDYRGLGLGLALVHKVAKLHEGAVAAYSDGPGRGSELVMRLPLAKPEAARPKVSRLCRDEIESGGKVLVVDDNQDFASMLAETLELLGHEVELANDATSAIALFDEHRPDVALLDINLPEMTGHELAEKLERRSGRGHELRLVAVTGYSDDKKRELSEQMGFDAHLVKPIVLSQLQQTLDSVFDDD
jgi:signal transduction histidine kinase